MTEVTCLELDPLAEKYQIECRSISNFFVGILDEYELVGGNRNRAVKCN